MSSMYFHPSVVKLTSKNYLSWKKGIKNHCIEQDIMPYLLGDIYEPSEYEQKILWFNSNDIVYGLIWLTIFEDILYHLEHTEFPFIAWTIIWQLYGDVDSSSKSDDSLDNQTSMGDTKISVASSCVNTSFVDDQFIDDLGASIVSSEIRVASLKAFNVSLQ